MSPYTLELWGKNDAERQMYTNLAWSNYQKQKIRATESQQKRKEVDKMKNKLEKIFATQESFMSYFSEALAKWKPKKKMKMFEGINVIEKNKEITISFSDIHF